MPGGGDLQLFTIASFGTLQGGALAAVLIPSVAVQMVPRSKKSLLITALLTAEVWSYVSASIAGGSNLRWLIAFLNGLVIFTSATGINQAAFGVAGSRGSGVVRGAAPGEAGRKSRQLVRSWL
jgi:hypothetical protein